MKKLLSVLCMTFLIATLCVGCGKNNKNDVSETNQTTQNASKDNTNEAENENSENEATIRVASLKGPTSLGLLQMMKENEAQNLSNEYEFQIVQAADEIVTKVVKGEVDVALVPANVAAVLYQKTQNQVEVVDINTLGVLYVVEHGENIQTVSDLAGKTICMTGKGQVPEYALSYILGKNNLSMDDVTVEYKSEPTEVIATLSAKEDVIGIIPMPFAASATMQDATLRLALNLTEEWNKVDQDSTFITGVTIVRKEFLEQNQAAMDQFINEHVASVEYVNANVEDAANLAESYDIIKTQVAKNAIPYCNIVSISGDEMKTKLAGYLNTLFDANAQSVGGTLPDEGFYYTEGTKQ